MAHGLMASAHGIHETKMIPCQPGSTLGSPCPLSLRNLFRCPYHVSIWVNYKGSGLEIRCMGRRPRCGPGSTSLPRGVSMSIHWPHPGGFWGARRSERSERSLLRAKEMSLLVYPAPMSLWHSLWAIRRLRHFALRSSRTAIILALQSLLGA